MRRFLWTLVLAVPCVAAQPETVTYDADLFFALAGLRDADDLAVGTAPAEVQAFFPSGTEVLGTRQSSDEWMGGRLSTVVGRTASPPETVRAQVEGAAPDGWRRPPSSPGEEYGFVSSDEGGDWLTFLRDDEQAVLSVTIRPRTEGGSLVMLHLRPVFSGESFGTEREWPRADLETKMPVLRAPSGARQMGSGGGGGDNHYGSNAVLETDLSLGETADHYRAGMETAGWSSAGEVTRPGVDVSTWMRMDGGDLLTAILWVQAESDGRYALGLSLARASE